MSFLVWLRKGKSVRVCVSACVPACVPACVCVIVWSVIFDCGDSWSYPLSVNQLFLLGWGLQ